MAAEAARSALERCARQIPFEIGQDFTFSRDGGVEIVTDPAWARCTAAAAEAAQASGEPLPEDWRATVAVEPARVVATTEVGAVSFDAPVNAITGDASFVELHGRQPRSRDEALRIRTHLAWAHDRLVAADTSMLSPEQRAARTELLGRLEAYRRRGRFPVASGTARRPTFVDEQGRHCAVAALLRDDGERAWVDAINARHKHDFVRELADTALVAWADRHGVTLTELGLIQPTYGPRVRLPRPDAIPEGFQFSERTVAELVREVRGRLDTCVKRGVGDFPGVQLRLALSGEEAARRWLSRAHEVDDLAAVPNASPAVVACLEQTDAMLAKYLQPHHRGEGLAVVSLQIVPAIAQLTAPLLGAGELEAILERALMRAASSCGPFSVMGGLYVARPQRVEVDLRVTGNEERCAVEAAEGGLREALSRYSLPRYGASVRPARDRYP